MNGDNFGMLGPALDLEAFKAEMLREMRAEISRAKQEIIDGMLKCQKIHFKIFEKKTVKSFYFFIS